MKYKRDNLISKILELIQHQSYMYGIISAPSDVIEVHDLFLVSHWVLKYSEMKEPKTKTVK